jgi:hypothetical protein
MGAVLSDISGTTVSEHELRRLGLPCAADSCCRWPPKLTIISAQRL